MARKSKNLPVNNDFLIFTNGKRSEKNYFEVLRGSFKSIYRIKVRFMNDAPDMLVRHAIGEKKKTNRVWCVFDKDEFTNKSICLAIKTAKENGINIAFSNMAFEVWLIDHFYQCKQEKTNEQLINDIDQLLKENGYSQGYAKNDFNLIKTMFIPRLDDAIQNADVVSQEYVREYRQSEDADNDFPVYSWNSYTNVHKLVKALKLERR